VSLTVGGWSRDSTTSRSSISSNAAAVLPAGVETSLICSAPGATRSSEPTYLKALPPVRRRFNDAVLEAVYIKDRRIGRTDFSEVFALLSLARIRTRR
jgi:hypothetical protein